MKIIPIPNIPKEDIMISHRNSLEYEGFSFLWNISLVIKIKVSPTINTIKDIISASKMILFALVYNCRSIIYEKTISIGTNKILNE